MRQQDLMQLLHQHGSLTTEQLTTMLKISRETIRRDLNAMQSQGKVLRQHGRARCVIDDSEDNGDPFLTRLKIQLNSKAEVARLALRWIDSGMCIALDASSTCWYLTKRLPDMDIMVFADSARVCQALIKRQHIRLICSGGMLQRKYAYYVNSTILSQPKNLEVDLFIFSCEGIDQAGVMWDSNLYNAGFKSPLLKRTAQSLLLIDKSKMRHTGEICPGDISPGETARRCTPPQASRVPHTLLCQKRGDHPLAQARMA